jgi:hypothetical protein
MGKGGRNQNETKRGDGSDPTVAFLVEVKNFVPHEVNSARSDQPKRSRCSHPAKSGHPTGRTWTNPHVTGRFGIRALGSAPARGQLELARLEDPGPVVGDVQ